MLQGLRAQLGLWHAGLMAFTLLGLAGFTFVLLITFLNSRADAALLEHADVTARELAAALYRGRGDPSAPSPLRPGMFDDLRSWGRYVQVVDGRGVVRERSDGLRSHPLPVSADALRRGLAGQVTFETVPGLGEHPVRIVTVPVRLGEEIPFLVQSATSLEGVEAALQRAGWILAVLTPTVFVISLIGGWLLVGRALRRVDALTQTALDIQATNLEGRIRHAGANDEIGRLAHAFDQMIARLDRSFQQARRFSADASHELKTPLTAIRGEAEVALMGELAPEEYRRSLQSILESSERMSEVVESLLLLSRVDAGQDLIRTDPVELDALARAAVDRLAPYAREQGVALGLGSLAGVTVAGDPLWLNQVLTNLITNGLKYTPAGGTVTVSVAASGDLAEITVTDTGIGIAAEHLPHIFDRFYRVDSGRARSQAPGAKQPGGTGLGLSITRWAVEQHGGTLHVDSAPGRGSTFRVRLPPAGVEVAAPPATTA
jgi:heavy metal sensor kinase